MGKVDYNLVIIGGGPSGLTAGLYASRAKLNVILIEEMILGGQIMKTDWIENYPGFPDGLSGFDLSNKIAKHAQNFGLNIKTDKVLSLDLSKKIKKIKLTDKNITAHAIIIASGASPRKLGVPNEKELNGKGISYCATCDGPLLKNKEIAVIGGGDTAVQESIFLTKFVKKVYLIHRRNEFRATKILQERAFKNHKIEFVWNTIVTGFEGLFSVEGLSLKNVKTGKKSSLKVDGCFTLIGIIPNTDFIENSLKMDAHRFIITDQNMETSVPGVYAIGDVRNTPLRQVITAAGDGAIAMISAEHYIENIK